MSCNTTINKPLNLNYSIFKNLSLAFCANIIGLIYGCIITFILPKFLGVIEYSYYQLYMFYAGYAGFLGLGWIDGLFLRYGGKYFEKINKSLISAEFRYFTAFETLISLILLFCALISRSGYNKTVIYLSISICILIYMPRAILHNLLLSVGRIKEYSKTLIIETIIKLILFTLGILLNNMTFLWFIAADLSGRLAASGYVYFVCRDYIFSKPVRFSVIRNEIAANIKCGIFLMLSNIAGMLIIGIIRQFIEIFWNVETFGRISLTLALSNFVLIFINSVSMVLFPVIKRCSRDNLAVLYKNIRTILMVIVLAALILYPFVKHIFSLWLPQYRDSINYMAVLFPVCVFESKMTLLINTYYKSERKERSLLFINILTFILSLIISYSACFILHSLDLAVLSIIIALAFRCVLSEIILSKTINVPVIKDIIIEVMLVCIFLCLTHYKGGLESTLIYVSFYIIYLFIKRKDILFLIYWNLRKKC